MTMNTTHNSSEGWEKTEQQLMDILHEFNRENLEEPFDGQPLMRRARKWNYARQITDLFKDRIQQAEAMGREIAVEFIRENYMKDGKSHYTTLAKVLEAALETPTNQEI